jgi:isocitrate dehydrogenase kinase/phosphatase
LEIEIDASVYESIDALKDSRVIDDIVNKVNEILQEKWQQVSRSSIVKSCKNSVSLLWFKKHTLTPSRDYLYTSQRCGIYLRDRCT